MINQNSQFTTSNTDLQKSEKNVLIFCVDQMRADFLGAAGRLPIRTPNLDRLVEEGMLFTRSYCTNPICMPARASMFTGLLPRDHGVKINGHYLNPSIPTLPGILKDSGYYCHAAGKLHLTPWISKSAPENRNMYPEDLNFWTKGLHNEFPNNYYGFSATDFVVGHTSYAHGEYMQWLLDKNGDPVLLKEEKALFTAGQGCYGMALPEELHYNRFITDSTIAAMEEAKAQEKPFFLWCSFPDPHLPVAPPAPYCYMYKPKEMLLPPRIENEIETLPSFYKGILDGELASNDIAAANITDSDWQDIIAGTCGMVTHIDTEIGRVLKAMEQSGSLHDTMILFVSDHGDMMGDHGLIWKGVYTFLGCSQIPTIVRLPDSETGIPRGRKSAALISQVDLMPSVLEYAGITHPWDNWTQQETPFPRGSVCPIEHFTGKSWFPIVLGKSETIRDHVIIENDNISLGYKPRCMVTDRYRITCYPGTPDGELFDLVNDPNEFNNLWYREEDEYTDLKSCLLVQMLNNYSLATPFHPIPPWNA